MEQPNGEEAGVEERERSAGHALDAYRERRRHRRGEDTYFGSSECLLSGAEAGVGGGEAERRRSEVLEDAEAADMPRALAEILYDIAREEGLDPDLGFELVKCGIGVCIPDEGLSNAPSYPTSDKYAPEWLDAPVSADDLLRERTLRLSFRRLRGLLERHEDAEEAIRAFAREPDVGHCGY